MVGTMKMPSSHAIAVVGRRFPGMMPSASTRMAKSITVRIRIAQDGKVSASGNGHSTGEPLNVQATRNSSERAVRKSYPGTTETKL